MDTLDGIKMKTVALWIIKYIDTNLEMLSADDQDALNKAEDNLQSVRDVLEEILR